MIEIIFAFLFMLGFFCSLSLIFHLFYRLSAAQTEIDTWKMYCRDAAEILNYYKPQAREYIGKKYNNTNNGEIITITDIEYGKENGYLFLIGETPTIKNIKAPYEHFAWWEKTSELVHLGVILDLRGDFKKGGAMYDTLTKEQKKIIGGDIK